MSELQFDRVESAVAPTPTHGEPATGSPPPLPEAESALQPAPQAAPRLDCQLCQAPIDDVYFEVSGAVVCSACHQKVLAEWNRGTPGGRLLRASFLGGLVGLLGCVVYYAVLKLTGYEFGLIAIAVGYGVGKAVRSGSGGRGGRIFQVLAVAITYASIVFSYVPLVLESAQAQMQQTAAASAAPAAAAVTPESDPAAPPAADPAAAAPPVASPAPAEAVPEMNPLVAFVVFFGVILVMPFLAGFQNILGLVIIGFGLWEAWRLNRQGDLQVAGPFRAGAPAAA